jgi:hypothetical protein
MHDSLWLQDFSRKTILAAFGHLWKIELSVIFPWLLLASALTTKGVFPRARCNAFEITFLYSLFSGELMKTAKLPPDMKERIGQSRSATSFTGQQIWDTLNMLCSFIVIVRNAPSPIRLNRIDGNRLEHIFEQTRLRCRDLNTMKRVLSGLADHFLQL